MANLFWTTFITEKKKVPIKDDKLFYFHTK